MKAFVGFAVPEEDFIEVFFRRERRDASVKSGKVTASGAACRQPLPLVYIATVFRHRLVVEILSELGPHSRPPIARPWPVPGTAVQEQPVFARTPWSRQNRL